MLLHRILNSLQQTAIYYAVIAGAFFALWLWWRKRAGKRKPLQAKRVEASQIRRELFTSIGSIIVFSSYLPLLFLLGFGEYTQFYPRIADHGWPYC
jgi:divalent metal cation (Fe/Co/Zn/Cd) transporter